MRPSMTGWSPRRESRWEFNEHVFLLRCLSKPTDQHREECEKVGNRNQCQSWCIFSFFVGGQKDRAISSVTTGDELNYSCTLSVCFSISFYKSEALGENTVSRGVGRTPVRIESSQSGFKVKGTQVKVSCLQVSAAYGAKRSLQTVWGQGAFRQRRHSQPHRCMIPTPVALKPSSLPRNP